MGKEVLTGVLGLKYGYRHFARHFAALQEDSLQFVKTFIVELTHESGCIYIFYSITL